MFFSFVGFIPKFVIIGPASKNLDGWTPAA